jgi:uncharacterized protein YxjI
MRYVIRERFWHLGEDSDITDDQGRAVYQVDGKALSINDRLVINDMSGTEVAQVHRRLLSLTPTFVISQNGEDTGEVRKHMFSPLHQTFSVSLGDATLEMQGELLSHEFHITKNGQTVAEVSKQWISLTSTYGVDVSDGENDLLILASVLALDLALEEERNR